MLQLLLEAGASCYGAMVLNIHIKEKIQSLKDLHLVNKGTFSNCLWWFSVIVRPFFPLIIHSLNCIFLHIIRMIFDIMQKKLFSSHNNSLVIQPQQFDVIYKLCGDENSHYHKNPWNSHHLSHRVRVNRPRVLIEPVPCPCFPCSSQEI